jgi:hypothetical protein
MMQVFYDSNPSEMGLAGFEPFETMEKVSLDFENCLIVVKTACHIIDF